MQSFYPGASPDVMTTSVTAILERQFGQMPGLKQMSSISSAGSSVITLQFDLNLSLDVAEQEVQAAINAGGSLLPQLPSPPVYAKVNPADAPVITLAISSSSLPITTVEYLADTRIAQKISQLAGVGLVSISGGQRPAVRVQANLQQLASYGLNLDDLRTTINNNNSNAPKGSFDGVAQSYTINANDQLPKPPPTMPTSWSPTRTARRCGCPGCGDGDARGREQQIVELGEHDAGRASQCPAPTRRQRDRGGRFDQGIAARGPGGATGFGRCKGIDRPHQHHPRLGGGCGIRTGSGGRAGGAGDLCVPAQPARDLHSQPVGAAFDRRHFRRDVSAWLFAQQSVPDGADDLDRLCGR